MNVLVGNTGFVGSNIITYGQIDLSFHSTDIEKAYGSEPDLLIYAGVRAEKYLANIYPKEDHKCIVQAQENIKRIAPKKLVLISTIDVLSSAVEADEDSLIDETRLQPYGIHRYDLEKWVRKEFEDALIIRLPALFGKNIKKNFIYDYMYTIPAMLKQDKYNELVIKEPLLDGYYYKHKSGFYKCRELSVRDEKELKSLFKKLGFSAISFTDSRNQYQFYPLRRLWDDIQTAMRSKLTLWHPATEPILVSELHEYLSGEKFINEFSTDPIKYDFRTKYDDLFGGSGGYICDKKEIMKEIARFVGDSRV